MKHGARRDTEFDGDILQCLRDVVDPEIGLNIVDLGLVYRARRTEEAIEVALTLTSRACPLGEMVLEDAREHLERCFDLPVQVYLVWQPAWSADFITEEGRRHLGHPVPAMP